eukprot:COSAG05_NODE_3717_length_1886_cov_1.290431_1_plen_295_part_10
MQVSHNNHGGSCEGSAGLNCATEGADGRFTCPAHGIVNSTSGLVDPLRTEEPLARPPPERDRHGSQLRPHGRPLYWAPAGNPRCPDFHEHISHCKHCDPGSPDFGQLLCGRIAAGAPVPGANTGAVLNEASARLHCSRTFFGQHQGGAWRPQVDGGPVPQHTNVKCGWCETPGMAQDGVTPLPNCQVASFEGLEFEAMGGAIRVSCPCAERYDSETTDVSVLYQPQTSLIFDIVTNPSKQWCRRCPVLPWDESEACYEHIRPGCSPAASFSTMCQRLETQGEFVGTLETDLATAD